VTVFLIGVLTESISYSAHFCRQKYSAFLVYGMTVTAKVTRFKYTVCCFFYR